MSTVNNNIKILGSMDIGDIISRAWRLYRLNFSKIIFYSFIPTIIFSLAQLLLNLPSLASNNVGLSMFACCCFIPTGFLILLGGVFVSVLFNFCMFKSFYNILTGEDNSYSSINRYAKENISKILILCGVIALEAIVFSIFDFIFIFIVMIIPILIIVAFTTIAESVKFLTPVVVIIDFILILSAIIIYVFVLLIQFLFCGLQIIILVAENLSIKEIIEKSYNIMSKDLFRILGFGFSLFSLWYIFVIFFNLPASVYMFYEMIESGSYLKAETYPIMIIIAVSFFANIVKMLIWPFVVSGITLYYYDSKVRLEGFDLLQSIRQEKNLLSQTIVE